MTISMAVRFVERVLTARGLFGELRRRPSSRGESGADLAEINASEHVELLHDAAWCRARAVEAHQLWGVRRQSQSSKLEVRSLK